MANQFERLFGSNVPWQTPGINPYGQRPQPPGSPGGLLGGFGQAGSPLTQGLLAAAGGLFSNNRSNYDALGGAFGGFLQGYGQAKKTEREERQAALDERLAEAKIQDLTNPAASEFEIKELADGYMYYVDPTGRTEPRRVNPNIQAAAGGGDEKEWQFHYRKLVEKHGQAKADDMIREKWGMVYTGDDKLGNPTFRVIGDNRPLGQSAGQGAPPVSGAPPAAPAPAPTAAPPTAAMPTEQAAAYGPGAFAGNIANKVSDALFGVSFAPQTRDAINQARLSNADLTTELLALSQGKDTEGLRKLITDNMPNPGEFWQGDQDALSKKQFLRQMVEDKIRTNNEMLANPGAHSGTTLDAARKNNEGLQRHLQRLDVEINSFRPWNMEAINTAPVADLENIPDSALRNMSAEERQALRRRLSQ